MANKAIKDSEGAVVGVDLAVGEDETVTLRLCDLRAAVRDEVKAAVDEVLQAILARAADSKAPTLPATGDDMTDDEVNELLRGTGHRIKGSS